MMHIAARVRRCIPLLPVIYVMGSACSESHASERFAAASSSDCDPALWKRVYKPSRLNVLNSCISATGVIQDIGPDDDGDTHMLLKLDAGQDKFINKKNVKKKAGNLVVEVVCSNTPTLRAAIKSCRGYRSAIRLPKVGDHVTVAGSYVIDTHNGWAEIHPVSRITLR